MIEKIKEIDLRHLYTRYDGEKLVPFGQSRYKRLLDNGYMNEDFTLTERGERLREKAVSKFKEMERGIPFEKRPKSNLTVLGRVSPYWFAIPFGDKRRIVLLDISHSMLIAYDLKQVKQKAVSTYRRNKVNRAIKEMTPDFNHNGIKAIPKIFQRTSEWKDFIWMQAEDTWVCIQAKFYDVIVNLFENVEFYTTKDGYAVFVQYTKRDFGIDGVLAIIMAVEDIECERVKNGG